MARGIERKIDELGRLTIPKEYRKAIGAKENDSLGMFVKDEILHLITADNAFVGFARNLDDLGRWTIPVEIRRTLNCETGQLMDIYVDTSDVFEGKKTICIRKSGCSWCNRIDHLIEVNGHILCRNCAADVSDTLHKLISASA